MLQMRAQKRQKRGKKKKKKKRFVCRRGSERWKLKAPSKRRKRSVRAEIGEIDVRKMDSGEA